MIADVKQRPWIGAPCTGVADGSCSCQFLRLGTRLLGCNWRWRLWQLACALREATLASTPLLRELHAM